VAFGVALAATSVEAAPEAVPEPPPPKLASPAEVTRCVESRGPEPCLKALHEYVKARPDQAFEAGRIATRTFVHWAAVPFFEQALAAKAGATRCQDERVVLALTSALRQPDDDISGATVASAARILRERCWQELRASMAQQIEKDTRGTFTRNACPVFIQKNFDEKSPVPAACWRTMQGAAPRATGPTWETLDPKRIQLEGTAHVYSAADGKRVTLAKVKDKPYYLVKFEGLRGPSNGKVVVHLREPAGSGHDYWAPIDGRRYVSLVARKLSGSDAVWEAHPWGGPASFRVSLDAAASKAIKAQGLLDQLNRQASSGAPAR